MATDKEETATTAIKRGEMVELESEALGKRKFPVEQAQNILNMATNRGWKLPSTSKLQHTNGKIVRLASTATANKG